MKIAELADRALYGAARVWNRRSMAAVAERDGHVQFEATVAAVTDLNPSMRRITLAAREFGQYALAGPDEYFGLLMPGADGRLHLPDAERINVRAAVAEMAEEEQPGLRWYTVRELRRATSELDVDIVTHGDAGPGSAWAVRAKVGDPVGFRSGGALYTAFDPARQLFVADETAVPALLAILQERSRRRLPGLGDAVQVHVEVPAAEMLEGLDLPAEVTVHLRGDEDPGTAVLAALTADPSLTEGFDYAWACGEAGLATSVRRHLVSVGMEKRDITFSGYWKLGAARG